MYRVDSFHVAGNIAPRRISEPSAPAARIPLSPIFSMIFLPRGLKPHVSDARGLLALVGPREVTVLCTKPQMKLAFRSALDSLEEMSADTEHIAAPVGCLAWRPFCGMHGSRCTSTLNDEILDSIVTARSTDSLAPGTCIYMGKKACSD